MSEVQVTRTEVAGGRNAYALTGTVNGEDFAGEIVIAASKVAYTHASLTTLTDGTEVLSFHKSQAAAAKGNAQIARKYHAGVRVLPVA